MRADTMQVAVARVIAAAVRPAAAVLLLALATPGAMRAEARRSTADPIEWIGHLGGFVTVMAVDGDRAYVADGPRLTVLDVAPGRPRLLGSTEPLPIHGPFHHLAAGGNIVFGSVPADPIQVLDVSRPERPTLVGAMPGQSGGGPLAVVGSTLFVSRGTQVLAVDVSDPMAPRELAAVTVYASCRQLLAEGGLLLAALSAGRGLAVIDIRDPSSPEVLKWFEDIDVHAMAPVDGLIAAVAGTVRDVPDQPGLVIGMQSVLVLDPSPEAPTAAIGRLELDEATPPAEALVSIGRRVFASVQSEVLEIDVSEPADPVLAGTFDIPPSSNMGSAMPRLDTARPGRLAAGQGRVYATFNRYDPAGSEPNESGVVTFDVSVPGLARETGTWSQAAPGNVDALAVVGDLLLVGETPSWRLRLYSIARRASPRQLSTIEVDTSVSDFAAGGELLVVLDAASYALHVLDIGDPALPVLVARQELWRATAVEIRDDMVYAAFHGPGETGDDVGQLAVLRITADGRLEEVFRWEGLPRVALDLAWAGEALAMTSQLEGITLIDVSEPIRPAVLGSIEAPYRAMATAWSGTTAYLAARLPTPAQEREQRPLPRYGGVMIVDASQPSAPVGLGLGGVRLDDYRGNVARWGIGVLGGYGLLAAAEGYVRVFDVSRVSSVDQVQTLRLPGVQGALATAGDYAYVAGADAGLSILRLRAAGNDGRFTVWLPLVLDRI